MSFGFASSLQAVTINVIHMQIALGVYDSNFLHCSKTSAIMQQIVHVYQDVI